MDSRLFQNLRERRGLCYSVQSETASYSETGLLSISVGLDAKRLPEALRLIRAEADALCDEPVGERELREARDYLVGQHALSMESTTNQMMWLGDSLLAHRKLVDPAQLREKVLAVSAGDVQAAAASILGEGLRGIAVVGPVKAREEEILSWYGRGLNISAILIFAFQNPDRNSSSAGSGVRFTFKCAEAGAS